MNIAFRSFSLISLAAPMAAAVVVGACATMAPPPASVANGAYVGPNGMTLYVFDKDTAGNGKSVCNAACATNWPPLMAGDTAAATGDYTVITRDDGKKQWAMKGKPLYYWSKDMKAGDTTGDGFMGFWHTAKP
jgi:predicted lipoprotein with Yx(FWY)xxD motif